MFKCMDCEKIVRKVEDVRSCPKCGSTAIPSTHADDDCLTPAILGYVVGTSFNAHAVASDPTSAPFSGDGGEFSGAGATVSYDSPSSDTSSSSDSSSASSDTSSDSSSSSSSDA